MNITKKTPRFYAFVFWDNSCTTFGEIGKYGYSIAGELFSFKSKTERDVFISMKHSRVATNRKDARMKFFKAETLEEYENLLSVADWFCDNETLNHQ